MRAPRFKGGDIVRRKPAAGFGPIFPGETAEVRVSETRQVLVQPVTSNAGLGWRGWSMRTEFRKEPKDPS